MTGLNKKPRKPTRAYVGHAKRSSHPRSGHAGWARTAACRRRQMELRSGCARASQSFVTAWDASARLRRVNTSRLPPGPSFWGGDQAQHQMAVSNIMWRWGLWKDRGNHANTRSREDPSQCHAPIPIEFDPCPDRRYGSGPDASFRDLILVLRYFVEQQRCKFAESQPL